MKTPEEMVKFLTAGNATGYGAIDAAIERGDVRMQDVEDLMRYAIDCWRDQDHVEVQLWNAAHDGVKVVQIDTQEGGRIRINLNDAAIWDGDPETGERIEILHKRDPDAGCEHTVFVAGQPTEGYTLEDVDPGAGYERSDWDDRIAEVSETYSPAFRQATLEALEAAGGSEYITDGDAWRYVD